MKSISSISVERFKSIIMSDMPFLSLLMLSNGTAIGNDINIKELFTLYASFNDSQRAEVSEWLADESNLINHLKIGNKFIFTCVLAAHYCEDASNYILLSSAKTGDFVGIDAVNLEQKCNDILAWYEDSVSAHVARMQKLGGGVSAEHDVKVYWEKKGDNYRIELDIELEFSHRIGEVYLWDTMIFEAPLCLSALQVAILLTTAEDFRNPAMLCGSREEKKYQDFPLSKYHPVRFEKTRGYIKQFTAEAKHLGVNQGSMNVESMNSVGILIARSLNGENMHKPIRATCEQPMAITSELINCETEKYMFYHEFRNKGRRIFDLNDSLVEMLHHTDFNNIPVSFLNSPFDCYYIHFGTHSWLKTESGLLIDGVYVEHSVEHKIIQFCFTTSPSCIEDVYCWEKKPDESLTISISGDDYDLTLDKALESVLESRRLSIMEKMSQGDRDATAEMREAIINEGEDLELLDGHTIIINDKTNASYMMDSLERTTSSMRAGLALVANAMCYLTAYPDDIDLDWATGTPRSLTEKAQKGHPKIKESTLSKLNSMGYRKVYLCGKKLNTGPADSESTGEGGGSHSKRRHWRRLHWRLQPYGKGRELRRAVLIAPTLINPGAGINDSDGVIYIDKNIINLRDAKKRLKIESKRYWE
jgi:hypothetical protein